MQERVRVQERVGVSGAGRDSGESQTPKGAWGNGMPEPAVAEKGVLTGSGMCLGGTGWETCSGLPRASELWV